MIVRKTKGSTSGVDRITAPRATLCDYTPRLVIVSPAYLPASECRPDFSWDGPVSYSYSGPHTISDKPKLAAAENILSMGKPPAQLNCYQQQEPPPVKRTSGKDSTLKVE